jgi:hypothetical protein
MRREGERGIERGQKAYGNECGAVRAWKLVGIKVGRSIWGPSGQKLAGEGKKQSVIQ